MVQAQFDGELRQSLQLVVRTEQFHVHALDHGRDSLVGDTGEPLSARPEEVQVGRVADVEELEVVLPGPVAQRQQPVVPAEQGVGRVQPGAALDLLVRLGVGQFGEPERLQLPDRGEDLAFPVLQQRVPVLEVVPGAPEELRHPRRRFVLLHRDRVLVDVPLVDAAFHAVGGRHEEVPGVELAQALRRQFGADRLERFDHRRPVLVVAEPELRLLDGPPLGLEEHVVRVQAPPVLGSFGHRLLVGAGEARALSGRGALLGRHARSLRRVRDDR
ncbi:MAG: hypothetical protein JF621_10955 [Streptomyces turgidiscabies]|nr:hypothetical protein [Streptomyces turgidiscabies]